MKDNMSVSDLWQDESWCPLPTGDKGGCPRLALLEEEREFGFERVGSPGNGGCGGKLQALGARVHFSALAVGALLSEPRHNPDQPSCTVCLIRPPQQVLKAIFSPALS